MTRLAKIKEAMAKLEAEAAATKAREKRERLEQAKAESDKAAPAAKSKADAKCRNAQKEAPTAERRAEEKARQVGRRPPDLTPRALTELPSHQVPADAKGKPTPKAQRNFTDPESCIMKQGTDYVQAYNCQAGVDASSQVIVAQAVTNQPPDVEHLAPIVEQVEHLCGAVPVKLSADSGYFSQENAAYCHDKGLDAYIATGRAKHGEQVSSPCGRPAKNLDAKGRMRRKLLTKQGRTIYARRKAVVEPVFGQIKQARGFRRFLLRGIEKVRAEWSLICTTHNLLKLFRHLIHLSRAIPLAATA